MDVFAAGVNLFMFITKRPPFREAKASDRWYSHISKKQYTEFWKMHCKGSIEYSESVKDLLNRMLAFDPEERPSIEEIKHHEWYLGEVAEISEINKEFKKRFDKLQELLKKKKPPLFGKKDAETGEYRAIGEEEEMKWNKTCHPYDVT